VRNEGCGAQLQVEEERERERNGWHHGKTSGEWRMETEEGDWQRAGHVQPVKEVWPISDSPYPQKFSFLKKNSLHTHKKNYFGQNLDQTLKI
jgi:hypothetical protein